MEKVDTKNCSTTGGNYIKDEDEFICYRCGAWDSDYETCTIPSYEMEYACPKHAPKYVNTSGKGAT